MCHPQFILIVNGAVTSIEEMRNFFDIVQCLYVYFGLSIKRYNIVSNTDDQTLTLKKVNLPSGPEGMI